MKHFRKSDARVADASDRELAPKAGRFLDYVLEMYAPPSQVKLRTVLSGRAGLMQDKARIRGYFESGAEKALGSGKR